MMRFRKQKLPAMALNYEYRIISQDVRQATYFMTGFTASLERDFPNYFDIAFYTEVPEVFYRCQVNIWTIVPLIWSLP